MKIVLFCTGVLLSQVYGFSPASLRVAPRLVTKAASPAPQFASTTHLFESVAAEEQEQPASSGGTATIPDEVFNLVKNIVGAGVLSLPAGIAAFGNAPSAVIPAVGLISAIGALSAYMFSMIGRVCSFTDATSYREAWSKSVGENSSWIPAAACTFKTTCAVLAYSMILADTCTNLLATVGVSVTRTQSLMGVTGLILLPLCWLKNLASLAPFSLVGIMGMVYTSGAMAFRYFGKAYVSTKVGRKMVRKFVVPEGFEPSFGNRGATSVLSPASCILISMLSTAFMAHFNAPKFYTELKDNTIPRYNKVVGSSFAISIVMFCVVAAMGFLTFGEASSGLILNNYANQDFCMSLSRIAVALSLVFSYPLAFVGVKEGLLDLLRVKDRSNSTLNTVTVAALSAVTLMALKIRDLSLVLSLAGATLGNALIYVFPALMFRSAVQKKTDATPAEKSEVKLALGSAVLGVVLGAIGVKMAIQSI